MINAVIYNPVRATLVHHLLAILSRILFTHDIVHSASGLKLLCYLLESRSVPHKWLLDSCPRHVHIVVSVVDDLIVKLLELILSL